MAPLSVSPENNPARWFLRACLLALAPILACGSRAPAHHDGGSGVAADGGAGADAGTGALLDPAFPLPSRAEAVSAAQALEASGEREGSGERAVALHLQAAAILERAWRAFGKEQDAKEAIELYQAAARDRSAAGACEGALRAAWLAGELAHDAEITYAELYKTQRRLAATAASSPRATTCAETMATELASLAAFRPPAAVVAAIDQGLAAEGTIPFAAASVPDAGAPGRAGAPRVVRIDRWPGREAARLVLVLDRPAQFRVGDEAGPGGTSARTFVELDGVDLGPVPRETRDDGSIVRAVRSEATATGARIVLDLDGRAYRRVFYLPEPYRVVVDVARRAPGPGGRGRRSVARVVLDPGHGGTDPGAIGPTGLREKDVTLDVAHRVAPMLARDGLEVALTRDDDRFIGLEERTARANAFNADVFVSIHCNAAETRTRNGVETYVLDTSRDDMSNRIAARENATSTAASAELGGILASMRLADQSARSTKLAELLQRSALAALRLSYSDVRDGGVHTAGFYVLVGARMPGVLFETSYVSNHVEEQRLATGDYRQRLADAIANALKAYREGR